MSAPGIPNIQYRVQGSRSTLEFWWSPPSAIGAGITSYNLIGSSTLQTFPGSAEVNVNLSPSTSYAIISSLTNAKDYAFALSAIGPGGTGPKAYFALAQPGIAPGGPSAIRASTMNNSQTAATIYWDFSENLAAGEGYNHYFVLSAVPSTSSATVSSFTVPLYPDQRQVQVNYLSTMFYNFLIQSCSDAGFSPPTQSTLLYVGPDRHFFPPSMSTLGMWMDAYTQSTLTLGATSTLNGVSGNLVTGWNDKSSKGINYTGPNQSYTPVYSYDTVISSYGLYFANGSGLVASNQSISPFSTNSANLTIFTMHRWSTITGGQKHLWGLYSGNPYQLNVSQEAGVLNVGYNSNVIAFTNNTSSQWLSGFDSYIASTNPLTGSYSISYYMNGTLLNASTGTNPLPVPTATGMNSNSNLNIGFDLSYNPGPSVPGFNGWIYEVVVYPFALGQLDRQLVEGYFAWKYWNTASSNPLPSNHPYKNKFPINTGPMEQVTTAISNVIITNITSTGFTANWTGGVGATQVAYLINGAQVTPSIDNGVSAQNATFTGLTSGQSINLLIIAYSDRSTKYSGTLYSPTQVSNMQIWFDASDPLNGTAVSLGTNISTWYDKSGNARNATLFNGISNGGNNISNNNSIIVGNDGYPYLVFGGNAAYNIPNETWMYSNQFMVFTVFQGGPSTLGFGIGGGSFSVLSGDGTGGLNLGGTDGAFWNFNNQNLNPLYVQNNYNPILASLSFDSSYNVRSYFNGFNMQSVTTSGYVTSGNIWNAIGSNHGSGANPFWGFGSGKLREIIAYQGKDDTSRQNIEGYLAWKWGLQSAAVAGNLYGAYHYYILGSSSNFNNNGTSGYNNNTYNVNTNFTNINGRYCLYFNSSNSALSFPLPLSANLTFAFWAYIVSGNNNAFFATGDTNNLSTSSGHNQGLNFSCNGSYFNGGGSFNQVSGGGTSGSNSWTPANFANLWHHFVIVVNSTAGTLSTYGDGVLAGTVTGITAFNYMNYANFGVQSGLSNCASFYLSMFSVHTSAFTLTQVKQLFNATQNALPQNHPYFSSPPYSYATATLSPFTLTSSILSSTSVYISWSQQITGATSYNYYINGNSVSPSINNGMSGQNATFTGLTTNTPYSFVVSAVIGSTNVVNSNALSVTISPPTAITNLTVYAMSTTGFSIKWTGGVGATSYTYTLSGLKYTPSTDAGVSSNYATFTGLPPGANYSVFISAISASGTTNSGYFWLPTQATSIGQSLVNWYDANDPNNGTVVNATNNTNITVWNDKAGYNYHATLQNSNGYLTNDGYNYINFNNTYYSMVPASWMLNTDGWLAATVTAIATPRNGSTWATLGSENLSTSPLQIFNNTTLSAGPSNNRMSTSGYTNMLNNVSYLTVSNLGSQFRNLYLGGVPITGTNNSYGSNSSITDQGFRYIGYDARYNTNLTGKMREILIYRNYNSSGGYTNDQKNLEGYLVWKWGLQASTYPLYQPQTYLLLQSDLIDRGSNPQSIVSSGVSTGQTANARLCTAGNNSSNNYIAFPWVYNGSTFTICLWCFFNDGGGTYPFLQTSDFYAQPKNGGGTNSSTGVYIAMYGGNFNTRLGYLNFSNGALANTNYSSSGVSSTSWHHVAVTYNTNGNPNTSGTFKTYIDGSLVDTASVAGYLIQTGFVTLLESTNGYMQYYCQYNTELTATQIFNIMASQASSLQQDHPNFSTPPTPSSGNLALITPLQSFAPTLTSQTPSSFVASWTPFVHPQGITSFTYTINGSTVTPSTDNGLLNSSATFSGLTTGIAYNLVVTAVTTNGIFQSSTLTVTLGSAPAAITNVQFTQSSGNATVSWSGGTGATSYNYYLNGKPYATGQGVVSTYTFTNPQNFFIETVVITAVNQYGTTSSTPYLSPSSLGTLKNWYDSRDPFYWAGTNRTMGGSLFDISRPNLLINQWYDKSGNNYNAYNTYGDGALVFNYNPQKQAENLTNISALSNWGAYIIPTTSWMVNSNFSVFIAMTPTVNYGTSFTYYPIGSWNSDSTFLNIRISYGGDGISYNTYFGSSYGNANTANGNSTGYPISPNFNRGIYSYLVTGNSNYQVNLNGWNVAKSTGQALLGNSSLTLNGVTVIGGGNGSTGGNFKGNFNEILMFSGDMSTTNSTFNCPNYQVVEAYLAYKWAYHTLAIPQGVWTPTTYLIMNQDLTDYGTNPVTVTNSGVRFDTSLSTYSTGKLMAHFGGGSNYCYFPVSLGAQFTISLWCANYNGASCNLLSFSPDTNDNTGAHVWTYGFNIANIKFEYSGGTASMNIGPNNNVKWNNQIVVTVDTQNNSIIGYWNGAQSNTMTGSGALKPINYIFLGGYSGNYNFTSDMAMFSVYDKVLTANQVQVLYNTQQTNLPQNHPFFSTNPQSAITFMQASSSYNTAINSGVASNVGSTGVTLTWSGGTGDSYGNTNPLAYIYTFNDVTVKPYQDYGSQYNFATFTGLTANTTYNVVITAVWNGNATTQTTVSFTTLMTPISNLTASSITATGFTISWSGGTGATSYTYALNGSAVTPSVNNGVASQTATFTGLTTGTNYAVTVTATNANGSISYPSAKTLWLDGKDPLNTGTAPTNGTSVTTWYDKSGRGNNSTGVQGTAPTYVSSSNSIVFSGSNGYNFPSGTMPLGDASYSVFAVASANPGVNTGANTILGAGANSSKQGFAFYVICNNNSGWNNGVMHVWIYGDVDTRPNLITANNFFIFDSHYQTGGTVPMLNYFNGAYASIYNCGVRNLASGTTGVGYGPASGGQLVGNISEILIFNTCLSILDRQKVQGYLAWKYGINGSLAPNHPYFSAAPANFVPGYIVKTA